MSLGRPSAPVRSASTSTPSTGRCVASHQRFPSTRPPLLPVRVCSQVLLLRWGVQVNEDDSPFFGAENIRHSTLASARSSTVVNRRYSRRNSAVPIRRMDAGKRRLSVPDTAEDKLVPGMMLLSGGGACHGHIA